MLESLFPTMLFLFSSPSSSERLEEEENLKEETPEEKYLREHKLPDGSF